MEMKKRILKFFSCLSSEERNGAQQPEKPTVPAGEQVQQEVPQEPAPAVPNALSADSSSVPSSSVLSDWVPKDPPSFSDWL